jgi:hypothetical protein
MKYSIIPILLFITACNNSQTENKLNGVYTTYYDNEFGRGNDTLSFSKANDGEGIYKVSKHLGVVKKLDGKEFPRELITETWTVEYDAAKQTLFELKSGKTLIWNSTAKTIQLGNTLYKRIAD